MKEKFVKKPIHTLQIGLNYETEKVGSATVASVTVAHYSILTNTKSLIALPTNMDVKTHRELVSSFEPCF